MGILNRDAILNADDIKRVEVELPEWGGSVFVHTMTAGERDRFESAYKSAQNTGTVRARAAVLCCRDAEGRRLFTDKDVAALALKSGAALGRIFNAVSEMNFITKEDVEELEGNCEGDRSDS